MESHLVLIFSKEKINNVCMLWLMIVMILLFKIPMKISLVLIHLLKRSLLGRVINGSVMIYILRLILHLIIMETVMYNIMNISLLFSQKLSVVMGHHIIVMNLSHRGIEKGKTYTRSQSF